MTSAGRPNSPKEWYAAYPQLKRDGNKYDRGHALIYGGKIMTGAARLAARAAQRSGAGLVSIATPQVSFPIYSEALESVMIRPVDGAKEWKAQLDDPKINALLIGPGLGTGETESQLVIAALATEKHCVIDADGLSNFANYRDVLFSKLHPGAVLTPHEGEFKRLFGTNVDEHADKTDRARQAAKIAGCVVLLKGADTVIASPNGDAFINANAPPWTATAGAGDVLAGMILGLVAQKMPVFEATAAAAWLHGTAAMAFGGPGMIAEDLIDNLPKALKSLSDSAGSV